MTNLWRRRHFHGAVSTDHHTVAGDKGLVAREELHGNMQSTSTQEVKDILVLAVPGLDT